MRLLRISVTLLLVILLAAMPLRAFASETEDSISTEPSTEASDPTAPETTEPEATEPETTEPEATEPETTVPETTAPPVVRINYSALTLQIAKANGLNKGDYTGESWAVLEEALETANRALNSGGQYTVNRAAKALETAIEELVAMDYTALRQALEAVDAFRQNHEELYDLWFEMAGIVPQAEELLGCGDQAAVDAATAQLSGLLEQVDAEVQALTYPVEVIKEVEVRVEVPPTTDYCNIGNHRTWPVLFYVNLGLNVVLAAALIWSARKRAKRSDNIPLIDYDIDDDIDSMD